MIDFNKIVVLKEHEGASDVELLAKMAIDYHHLFSIVWHKGVLKSTPEFVAFLAYRILSAFTERTKKELRGLRIACNASLEAASKATQEGLYEAYLYDITGEELLLPEERPAVVVALIKHLDISLDTILNSAPKIDK